MKAVVIHKHGGPDELVYQEIETPSVGASDVLIEMKAIGLNHFDLDVRDGISGYFDLNMPHILGCEGAGIVKKVGSAVTAFIFTRPPNSFFSAASQASPREIPRT